MDRSKELMIITIQKRNCKRTVGAFAPDGKGAFIMKRNKIYMMCMILAGILFFGSLGAIVRIYMSYQEGEQVYEELAEYIREPESNKEPEGEKSSEENSEFTFLQVDFESLQSINPEVIAWIQIPALDISYPVAKGTDNDYYLHHMINGETHKSGSIFMDYHNQKDFTDSNTIIYGHNMRDGSMFGTLETYQDSGVYDVYPKFYVYVPGYVYEYHIFSCYAAPVNHVAYTYSFTDVKDYQKFLAVIQASSEYDTGISVSEKDRVITLSTCVNTRKDYRYLVHGRLDQKITIEFYTLY